MSPVKDGNGKKIHDAQGHADKTHENEKVRQPGFGGLRRHLGDKNRSTQIFGRDVPGNHLSKGYEIDRCDPPCLDDRQTKTFAKTIPYRSNGPGGSHPYLSLVRHLAEQILASFDPGNDLEGKSLVPSPD